MSSVSGQASSQFESVMSILQDSFDTGADLGGGICVTLEGETVVNIWGGYQDRAKKNEWQEGTLPCIFSSGKAVMAILIAGAVEHGLLDYNQPVAHYWPEFSQHGKAAITVAEALSHQAGLCGFPDEMDPALWLDWEAITMKLAKMPPLWTPGSASGYHPQNFGFLAGELLRRVTGKMPGQLIREYFHKPLGYDIFCGLTEVEISRTTEMIKPPSAPILGDINQYKNLAFLTKWSSAGSVDFHPRVRAQIPGSNMYATARGLAEVVVPLANNGYRGSHKVFSSETLKAVFSERISGQDLVLPYNISWAAGLIRNINGPYGPVPTTLGHSGFGGSCVFADPENRLTFSYVMNKMSPDLMGDPRSVNLIEAVYQCL